MNIVHKYDSTREEKNFELGQGLGENTSLADHSLPRKHITVESSFSLQMQLQMIKECTPPAGCVLLYPTAIFLFQSFYSVRSWGKIGHLYLVRDDLCSVRMLPPDWSYLVYLHIPAQSSWWWWVIDGEAHSWSDNWLGMDCSWCKHCYSTKHPNE